MGSPNHKKVMKRFLLSSLLALATLLPAFSMSYEEARQQAWFLTDKMAYELNLTPDQYDRAYQINLDYLMSIRTASDCDGYYWRYRDADFRCVLFDWQYQLYATLDYFFRPVRWVRSAWYYPVCDHYRMGYYYFDRPTVYVSYRGGMWNRRGHESRSPYYAYRPVPGYGMRNHYADGPRPYYGRPQGGRPGQMRPDDHRRPDGGGCHDANRPGWNAERPSGGNRPNGNRPQGYDRNNGRTESNGSSTPNRGHNNGNQRPSMNRGNSNVGGFRQVGNSPSRSGSAAASSRGNASAQRGSNGSSTRVFGR